jgi:hypothetical protein
MIGRKDPLSSESATGDSGATVRCNAVAREPTQRTIKDSALQQFVTQFLHPIALASRPVRCLAPGWRIISGLARPILPLIPDLSVRKRRQMRTASLRVRDGGRVRRLVTATLLTALATGTVPTPERTGIGQTADTLLFEDIYYDALLSGRDADAALRKAQFLTGSLMQHFGMRRSDAAALVARMMITRSGLLCSGG